MEPLETPSSPRSRASERAGHLAGFTTPAPRTPVGDEPIELLDAPSAALDCKGVHVHAGERVPVLGPQVNGVLDPEDEVAIHARELDRKASVLGQFLVEGRFVPRPEVELP